MTTSQARMHEREQPIALIVKAGLPMATSLDVAEKFGKRHKHVIRSIEKLCTELKNEATELNFEPSSAAIEPKIGLNAPTAAATEPKIGLNAPTAGAIEPKIALSEPTTGEEFGERNFVLGEYSDVIGRSLPMYHMTRDGFSLLAMGFTGITALRWKIHYIQAFNDMEQVLREQARVAALEDRHQSEEDLKDQKARYSGRMFELTFERICNSGHVHGPVRQVLHNLALELDRSSKNKDEDKEFHAIGRLLRSLSCEWVNTDKSIDPETFWILQVMADGIRNKKQSKTRELR